MGPDSPLSEEEKMIFSRVRRGDPVGLVGMDSFVADRTMSRRLQYIRKRIQVLG